MSDAYRELTGEEETYAEQEAAREKAAERAAAREEAARKAAEEAAREEAAEKAAARAEAAPPTPAPAPAPAAPPAPDVYQQIQDLLAQWPTPDPYGGIDPALRAQLDELRNANFGGWLGEQGYSWINPIESQPYSDLSNFIAQMQDPTQQAALQQQMTDYISNMLGVDYAQRLPQLDQDIARKFAEIDQLNLYGPMNPEAERQLQRDIQTTKAETASLVDALVGSGRGMSAWGALDELNSQIQTLTTHARLEYSTNYLAKKEWEYQALAERYSFMSQAGMAAGGQFQEMMQNQRLMTLQGYMSQMNAVIAQDQMYMDQYNQHIDTVYKGIMAQIGVDEHEVNMAYDYYAAQMTPYLDQLNAMLDLYSIQTAGELLNA